MEMNAACPPAMVYPVMQKLGSIYEPRQAIRNGTLFPELNKPMKESRMPIDGPAATSKQALAFAAWETRLYLNTHPDDRRDLELYRRLCGMLVGPNYACTFVAGSEPGPCPCPPADGWRWLDDPWPWEYQGCNAEVNNDVCV